MISLVDKSIGLCRTNDATFLRHPTVLILRPLAMARPMDGPEMLTRGEEYWFNILESAFLSSYVTFLSAKRSSKGAFVFFS